MLSLPQSPAATAQRIANRKLIVILRNIPLLAIEEVAQSLKKAGVEIIEVAMNSRDPIDQLLQLKQHGFCVGAGTILHQEEAEQAVKAGAQFLFSPVFRNSLIPFCRQRNVLAIPGAFSPTEIQAAFQQGCVFVKLFPSVTLGPDYLKQLLAPFPGLQIIPAGGINLNRAARFFQSGAAAVAVGTDIVNVRLIKQQQFNEIITRARAFVSLIARMQKEQSKLRGMR